MKLFTFVFFLLFASRGFSQGIMPKDSIVSILLVSHRHSKELPIINHFKRHQDIIFFLNIKDKDMFCFIDAEYTSYGTIHDFHLDSTGLMRFQLDLNIRKRGKITKQKASIEHTIGDAFFIVKEGGKVLKHIEITCEFHNEKLFNVDLP
jgi:hypothetical protein